MGLLISKGETVTQEEKEIAQEIEEWLVLRNNTIAELTRVADELDNLHKKATYSKLAGGIAGAIGGGIALGGLMMSFFTGGTSLLLTGTGLTIAAGGGVTATVAELVEFVKKKTRVDAAQKALEKDKAAQAQLLAKIENTVDTVALDLAERKKLKANLKTFLDGVQKLWFSGMKMYGWAKSGQAIYSTVKWAKGGSYIWKFGASQGLKRTLMTVGGGLAGSLFMLVDLGYVIHHAMLIKNGNPSDAARSIRSVCALLRTERDKITNMVKSH